MSMMLQASIWPQQQRTGLAFQRLLQRLGRHGQIVGVQHACDADDEAEETVPYTSLKPQDQVFRLEGSEFRKYVEDVAASADALGALVGYKTASGRELELRVTLHGRECGHFAPWVGPLAPIDVICGYPEAMRPPPEMELTRLAWNASDESRKSHRNQTLLLNQLLLRDLQELFLTLSGTAPEEAPGGIDHCFLAVDRVVSTPLDCTMVFHARIEEFAVDLGRIFLEAHHEVPMAGTLYGAAASMWEQLGEARDFFCEVPELTAFLQTLDKTTAVRLASTELRRVRSAFAELAKDTSFARCLDLGEQGAALMTLPPRVLAMVYVRLAELVRH